MSITILQSNANKVSILTQQHPTLDKVTLPKYKHEINPIPPLQIQVRQQQELAASYQEQPKPKILKDC